MAKTLVVIGGVLAFSLSLLNCAEGPSPGPAVLTLDQEEPAIVGYVYHDTEPPTPYPDLFCDVEDISAQDTLWCSGYSDNSGFYVCTAADGDLEWRDGHSMRVLFYDELEYKGASAVFTYEFTEGWFWAPPSYI